MKNWFTFCCSKRKEPETSSDTAEKLLQEQKFDSLTISVGQQIDQEILERIQSFTQPVLLPQDLGTTQQIAEVLQEQKSFSGTQQEPITPDRPQSPQTPDSPAPAALIVKSPIQSQFKKGLIDNVSRRSTVESIQALELASVALQEAKCNNCQGWAIGFCIGCPGKRFCQECFSETHSEKKGIHRLCKYDKSNTKSMKLINSVLRFSKSRLE